MSKLPKVAETSFLSTMPGCLLVWLMMPPVEPRPKMSAEGPFITSIDSVAKTSRLYSPRSRTPSMKRSPPAGKPRR